MAKGTGIALSEEERPVAGEATVNSDALQDT
jgi:hypothetical protein